LKFTNCHCQKQYEKNLTEIYTDEKMKNDSNLLITVVFLANHANFDTMHRVVHFFMS